MTNPIAPPPVIPRVADEHPIPAAWAADTDLEAPVAQGIPSASGAFVDRFADVAENGLTKVVRVAANRRLNIPEHLACEACGGRVDSIDEGHPAVARVVRQGQRYGSATAGELVMVELKECHGAALEATVSLADYRRAVAARQAPRSVEKPVLVRMVEQSFGAAEAQSKALLARARASAERDAARARAEAEELYQQGPAPDLEEGSQPTAPITGSER